MKLLLLSMLSIMTLPTTVYANWFGRYSSYYEASTACDEWADAGGKFITTRDSSKTIDHLYDVWLKNRGEWRTYSSNIRKCRDDDKTNKILGIATQGVKRGKTYNIFETDELKITEKVVKRFSY
tara:strand:+ start:7118 stop:7489 length:372 start_codon:yes stop_codon:yes gene_type:complete